jgi:nucleoside phosphorylase
MFAFSTILSAAKPSERSDQYLILGAMFCLDAHSAPVTAKQIRELLQLHLGSKLPANVNASLRAYDAYVEPAEKGPPLRWRLTPQGLQALRAMSGLELATRASGADFETDVGIVCALEQPEFEALMNAMGGPEEWKVVGSPRFPHVYRETKLATTSGKNLRIVGSTSTPMGLTAAAIVTTHLILQFKPRLVVMVGIAAGTRAGGRGFGDVLVADPSVDYKSGKVSFAGGIREFLPDPYPIGLNPRLRSVLHKYRGDHPVFAGIRGRWSGSLPPGSNRVHIGPLGAADQVIDDESRILEIQRNWRKLIGVEMETYGVYRACYESPDPKPRFVSFKAVCDFAAVKSDSWQQYAAFVAAEFTTEFLKNEWDALWPNVSN